MNRYDLSDFEWSVIQPSLTHKPCGVRRVDDGRMLNGSTMWVLRSGVHWRDLPNHYGTYSACRNRFNRWRRKGIWDRLMETIVDACDGDIWIIDRSSDQVHQFAASLGGSGSLHGSFPR